MENNNEIQAKRLDKWSFFKNDKGELQYHQTCVKCTRQCKQSFRVLFVGCSKNTSTSKTKKSK